MEPQTITRIFLDYIRKTDDGRFIPAIYEIDGTPENHKAVLNILNGDGGHFRITCYESGEGKIGNLVHVFEIKP